MNSERFSNKMELASAIVMSLAALLTAWCGFQNSRWGSIQSVQLAEANLKHSDAMEKTLDATQHHMMDGIIALNFINGVVEGRQELCAFYIARARPELSKIMAEWLESKPLENKEAYPHPLASPEYAEMIKKQNAESEALRKEAETSRATALYADKIGDNYLLLTILFSAVLFLGGIESKFDAMKVRLMLLSLSGLLFLFSVYRLVLLPLAGG